MYVLFENTYDNYPGETNIVRVSAVKQNLIFSVAGDDSPLLTDEEELDNADNNMVAHYFISEVEEV